MSFTVGHVTRFKIDDVSIAMAHHVGLKPDKYYKIMHVLSDQIYIKSKVSGANIIVNKRYLVDSCPNTATGRLLFGDKR